MDKNRTKEEVRLLIEKYNRLVQKERGIKSKEEENAKKKTFSAFSMSESPLTKRKGKTSQAKTLRLVVCH